MNGPLDFRLRPLTGNTEPVVPKLYPAAMASSSTTHDGENLVKTSGMKSDISKSLKVANLVKSLHY